MPLHHRAENAAQSRTGALGQPLHSRALPGTVPSCAIGSGWDWQAEYATGETADEDAALATMFLTDRLDKFLEQVVVTALAPEHRANHEAQMRRYRKAAVHRVEVLMRKGLAYSLGRCDCEIRHQRDYGGVA